MKLISLVLQCGLDMTEQWPTRQDKTCNKQDSFHSLLNSFLAATFTGLAKPSVFLWGALKFYFACYSFHLHARNEVDVQNLMTYFCSALCRLSCSDYGNGWSSWRSYGTSNCQEVWLLNINHCASYSFQLCKIINYCKKKQLQGTVHSTVLLGCFHILYML